MLFVQGLIKIRGDQCWRDLTCMNYHYEVSGNLRRRSTCQTLCCWFCYFFFSFTMDQSDCSFWWMRLPVFYIIHLYIETLIISFIHWNVWRWRWENFGYSCKNVAFSYFTRWYMNESFFKNSVFPDLHIDTYRFPGNWVINKLEMTLSLQLEF